MELIDIGARQEILSAKRIGTDLFCHLLGKVLYEVLDEGTTRLIVRLARAPCTCAGAFHHVWCDA